jgi:hypothetical protein
METEKKELETSNISFQRKFSGMERELKNLLKENQRLTLRTKRGAPYY